MRKLLAYFTLPRVLIIGAAIALYSITLNSGYSIDDSFVTKKGNITTQGLKAIPEILVTHYAHDDTGANYDYRPVVKISFAIEHQFFGVTARGSHFFNLFIYIICLMLIYRLAGYFVNDPQSRIPLYISLLFALLPIHTEVVTSIKNRDILLSFLFSLLAALTLFKAEQQNKKVWLSYILAGFYMFTAMLAKFDAVTGIASIPALVFIRLKPSTRRRIFIVVCLLAGAVAARVMTRNILPTRLDRGYCYFENPLFFDHSFSARIIGMFDSLGFYVMQCIFPFKQSCYYGVESIEIKKLGVYGWFGIASACAGLYGLVYAFLKKKDGLLWGIFVMAAGLSMFLNFVKPAVGIVADRFTFFGSFGFCIVLVFLFEPLFRVRGRKIAITVIAMLVIGSYSYLAIVRNYEWKNTGVMIESDLRKYPNSSYLNYLYATCVMDSLVKKRDVWDKEIQERKITEIKTHLARSITISNDYPKAYDFISSVMVFLTKEYKEALPYITRGLQLHANADLLYYKGVCFSNLQQRDSAEFYLKRGIAADPRMLNAYTLLAQQYNAAGQYEKSIELFNGALQKGVENEFTYTGLAVTYFEMKDTLGAVFYSQKALAINPESGRAKQILEKLQ